MYSNTNGNSRSSRTVWCATSSPPTATAHCSGSLTAVSASATRPDSSVARTRSWTGWRPTSPATSCQTGRHVVSKSINEHNIWRRTDMSHNGSDIAAPAMAIAYHSGFGHTAVLAEAVAAGAREAGAHVRVIAVDKMTDEDWDVLDAADGIVFGSATYMGNASAGFQTFAEQTGRRCMNGTWRDKVAAGFTNSGAKSGDKMNTLAVFAAQHHMHWVNLGLGAGWNSATGSENDLNRLGFWLGAGAATDVDANSDQVHPADVQTCRHLGWRVAVVTRQLNVGRSATPAVSSPAASSAPTH